jgi:hypothetical protein
MGQRPCEHAANPVFGTESSDVCMDCTVFPIKGGWSLSGWSEYKIYRILILLRTVNVPNESCVIRYMDGYSVCHPSTRGRSEKEKGDLD